MKDVKANKDISEKSQIKENNYRNTERYAIPWVYQYPADLRS